jgi:hypothetical protein
MTACLLYLLHSLHSKLLRKGLLHQSIISCHPPMSLLLQSHQHSILFFHSVVEIWCQVHLCTKGVSFLSSSQTSPYHLPIPKAPITTCTEPHPITTTAARVLDLFNCKPSTDAQICSTTFTKAPSTSIFAMVTTASKKNALASNRDAKRRMEKCQLQTNGSHLEGT